MEVMEPNSRYLAGANTHQTEVGQLPADWSAVALADLLTSKQLGGNYKNGASETSSPLIKMGNLSRGRIDLGKIDYIHPSTRPSTRDRLKADDVLFNTRNTLDLVGKVALWRDELPEAYFNSNIMRMCFDLTRVGSNAFMNYVLNTSRSVSALRAIATGTTSVAAIYSRDFTNVFLPLPCSRTEQRAIAEALTDADALIDSLEQLLTKKRQIKQGSMQELLTGMRRLPGFAATWDTVRLGRLLKFQTGFPFPSSLFCSAERGLRLIRNRDLKSNDDVVHFGGAFDSQFVVKCGDVLVGMDGDFMPCLWGGEDALLNQRVGRVLPLRGLDPTFAYYFLIDKLKAIEASTGSTTVKHLSHGDVEGIEAAVPELPEQVEIGALLRDLDMSITALESRLTKARALKQAMAQALLTGRIRLVESTA